MTIRNDLNRHGPERVTPVQHSESPSFRNSISSVLKESIYSHSIDLNSFLRMLVDKCGRHCPVRKVFIYGESALNLFRGQECGAISIGIEFQSVIDEAYFFTHMTKLPIYTLMEMSGGLLQYVDIIRNPSYHYNSCNERALLYLPFSKPLELLLIRQDIRSDNLELIQIDLGGDLNIPIISNGQFEQALSFNHQEITIDINKASRSSEGLFRFCLLLTQGYKYKNGIVAERAYMEGFKNIQHLQGFIKRLDVSLRKAFLINLERMIYCSLHPEKEAFLEMICLELKKLRDVEAIGNEIYISPSFFDKNQPFNHEDYYHKLFTHVRDLPDPSLVFRDQEMQLARQGIQLQLCGKATILQALWDTGKPEWRKVAIKNRLPEHPKMESWIEEFFRDSPMKEEEFVLRFALVKSIVDKNLKLESHLLTALEKNILKESYSATVMREILQFVLSVKNGENEGCLAEFVKVSGGSALLHLCSLLCHSEIQKVSEKDIEALSAVLPMPEELLDAVSALDFQKKALFLMHFDRMIKSSKHAAPYALTQKMETILSAFSIEETMAIFQLFSSDFACQFFMSHYPHFNAVTYIEKLEKALPADPTACAEFLQKQEFFLYFVGASLDLSEGIEKGVLASKNIVWIVMRSEKIFAATLENAALRLSGEENKEKVLMSAVTDYGLSLKDSLRILRYFSEQESSLQVSIQNVLRKHMVISEKSTFEELRSLLALVISMRPEHQLPWALALQEIWKESFLYHYAELLTLEKLPPSLQIENLLPKNCAETLGSYVEKMDQKIRRSFLLNVERIAYSATFDGREETLAAVEEELKKASKLRRKGNVSYATRCLFDHHSAFDGQREAYVLALKEALPEENSDLFLRDQELQLRRHGIKLPLCYKKDLFEAFWDSRDEKWHFAALKIASDKTLERLFCEFLESKNLEYLAAILTSASPSLFFALLSMYKLPQECQKIGEARLKAEYPFHLSEALKAATYNPVSREMALELITAAKEQKIESEALALFKSRASELNDRTLITLFSFDPEVALVENAFKNHKFQKVSYVKALQSEVAQQEDKETFLLLQESLLRSMGLTSTDFMEIFLDYASGNDSYTQHLLGDFFRMKRPLSVTLQVLQRIQKVRPDLMEQVLNGFVKHLQFDAKVHKIELCKEIWGFLKILPASPSRNQCIQKVKKHLGELNTKEAQGLFHTMMLYDPEAPLDTIKKYFNLNIGTGEISIPAGVFKTHYRRFFKEPFPEFFSFFQTFLPYLALEEPLLLECIEHVAFLEDSRKRTSALVQLSYLLTSNASDAVKLKMLEKYSAEFSSLVLGQHPVKKKKGKKAAQSAPSTSLETIATILNQVLKMDFKASPNPEVIAKEALMFVSMWGCSLKQTRALLHPFEDFIFLNWKWFPKKSIFSELLELFNKNPTEDKWLFHVTTRICLEFQMKSVSDLDKHAFLEFLDQIDSDKLTKEHRIQVVNKQLDLIFELGSDFSWEKIWGRFEKVGKKISDEPSKKRISQALLLSAKHELEKAVTVEQITHSEGPGYFLKQGILSRLFQFADGLEFFMLFALKCKELKVLGGDAVKVFNQFFLTSYSLTPVQKVAFYLCVFRCFEESPDLLEDAYLLFCDHFMQGNAYVDARDFFVFKEVMIDFMEIAQRTEDLERKGGYAIRACGLFTKFYINRIALTDKSVCFEKVREPTQVFNCIYKEPGSIRIIEWGENVARLEKFCHQLAQIAHESEDIDAEMQVQKMRGQFLSPQVVLENGVRMFKEVPPLVNVGDASYSSLERCFATYHSYLQKGEWSEEEFFKHLYELIPLLHGQRVQLLALAYHLLNMNGREGRHYAKVALTLIAELKSGELWLEHKKRLLPMFDNPDEAQDIYSRLLCRFCMSPQLLPLVKKELFEALATKTLGFSEAIFVFETFARYVALKSNPNTAEKDGLGIVYMIIKQKIWEHLDHEMRCNFALSALAAAIALQLNGGALRALNQACHIVGDIPEEDRRDNSLVGACMFELFSLCLKCSGELIEPEKKIEALFIELFLRTANLSEVPLLSYSDGDAFLNEVLSRMDKEGARDSVPQAPIVSNLFASLAATTISTWNISDILERNFEIYKDNFPKMGMLYTVLPHHFPTMAPSIGPVFITHIHYLRMLKALHFPEDTIYTLLESCVTSNWEVTSLLSKCYYHTALYFSHEAEALALKEEHEKAKVALERGRFLVNYLKESGLWETLRIAPEAFDDPEIFWKDMFGVLPTKGMSS